MVSPHLSIPGAMHGYTGASVGSSGPPEPLPWSKLMWALRDNEELRKVVDPYKFFPVSHIAGMRYPIPEIFETIPENLLPLFTGIDSEIDSYIEERLRKKEK